MFQRYVKSNKYFLSLLMLITILDIILIFRGNVTAISNIIFIILYINVDYRFYEYRENQKMEQAMENFLDAMDNLNKDLEKIFNKKKENDENKDD